MPNEVEGMNCMCGCHILDDPANHGQRCDLCGCVAGFGRMMTQRDMDEDRRQQQMEREQ
jgi:hypothetical protein